ncbi:MAG TPA: hypothetical protein DCS07_00670 [Bdellovibrionales bacterium]|nr:MAG: hypothetical protein A2Z97_02170 [Bdellovibrionales bacterium GWB1_52_6]OFZ02657.1 MAG: hypothetical protein A2X97_08420 [Bdellovibrionales bacterium GWA1_52_35]OFZ36605.1 MAG: hypothetical protein A2070_02540 [Bdellovibrionales bacterium GWC1_52_8]HAR41144.1 hypothetical protein [Bdellovibrionales bacterium]HCM41526.1 hypothetical protein [Bdellovibrionales bacterium]
MKKKYLRVLSYNIHKGFSTGNRRFVLGKIREAIRVVHADLVFLQEVLGKHSGHSKAIKEWPTEPQFEYLADEIWPHHAYGKNAVYTAGHHGNAILSKYPIRLSENIDVSMTRLEHRGLLHAVIDVPGHAVPVHAICVHFALFESARKRQILKLCERIESHVPHIEPVIIAGDFNDWRARASDVLKNELNVSEAFQKAEGDHARTFPAWLPTLQLDRIYFRGMDLRSAQCLTGDPWNALSDHAALSAELSYQ